MKNRWFRVFAVLVSLTLVALLGATAFLSRIRHRPVHVADNFESTELSPLWMADRMVPGAFTVQHEIVRDGHHTGQMTLHPRDMLEAANDMGAATERDELLEHWRFWSQAHHTYAQSFSLYLPTDFPLVNDRLVIAQWKQVCFTVHCHPNDPVLAIRYVNGELFITRKNDAGEVKLFSTHDEVRGQWLNFRFITRFSSGKDGLIDVSLNDKNIAHFEGVTAYHSDLGYLSVGAFFFKMGLYRDLLPMRMTLYMDDYRKDECSDSASCL
jgi:Polysaccharide lyase